MKQFIRSAVLFSVFFAVTYPIFIYSWGSLAPQILKPNLNYCFGLSGHIYSRLKEVKNTTNVDVLFLGSSHAYRGFDVRIFEDDGLKVFNLGSSNQTPIQTKFLLRKYLDKLNPKVIVFEVFPGTFQSDGVEGSLCIISNDRNDINSLKMALKINHIITYNTLIYAHLRDIFHADTSFHEPKQKGNDTYISGGYVEKIITRYEPEEHTTKDWIFRDEQFVALEENITMIKERDIEFIIVYAPITSSFYKSYTNNDTFDDKMREFGSYYNFNLIMDIGDDMYFYDSHHLNQIGVKLFSRKVLEIIRELAIF